MLYNSNGDRLRLNEGDNVLGPFFEKMIKDYPKFEDGNAIVIEAKESKMRKVEVYVGATETDARKVRDQRDSPPNRFLTARGYYMNKKGQKEYVYFSTTPIAKNANGQPDFSKLPPVRVGHGHRLTSDNIDEALFLYCFKPELDKGGFSAPGATFEFVHPELKAAARRQVNPNRILEDEIMTIGTCMPHESVKQIMGIMGLHVADDDDIDRGVLFDHVLAMPDRTQYETAKKSVVNELPKENLSDVSKVVTQKVKDKVLFEDKKLGSWMIKKSDVLTEKVVATQGATDKDKLFALKEYYSSNPAAFEELQNV